MSVSLKRIRDFARAAAKSYTPGAMTEAQALEAAYDIFDAELRAESDLRYTRDLDSERAIFQTSFVAAL